MSSRTQVYELLEDKMVTYSELLDVPVVPSGENMVPITPTAYLGVKPIDPNMSSVTGEDIYVREAVADRLGQASMVLARTDRELQLQVVYGYRSLNIQRAKFERIKAGIADQYQDVELLEATHRMVAVPEVAGHPTGGATDVQITKDDKALDFGTPILGFVPDSYAFSPYISPEAWANRQLLRRCMIQAGFAPFDGEWWHFSYGDREWARYYNEPNAVYEQIEFSTVQEATA